MRVLVGMMKIRVFWRAIFIVFAAGFAAGAAMVMAMVGDETTAVLTSTIKGNIALVFLGAAIATIGWAMHIHFRLERIAHRHQLDVRTL